jgi:hypothetical protein
MYHTFLDFWVRSLLEAAFLPYRLASAARRSPTTTDTSD